MPTPVLIHLSLLALMVLLCIAAAVVARRRAGNWLSLHRILGLAGACSGLSGVGVMVGEKIEHGYPHFSSPHAIIGLTVAVMLIVVPLLGFLGTRGLVKLRAVHRVLARILIAVGMTALATGVLRYLQIYGWSSEPAAPEPPASAGP